MVPKSHEILFSASLHSEFICLYLYRSMLSFALLYLYCICPPCGFFSHMVIKHEAKEFFTPTEPV